MKNRQLHRLIYHIRHRYLTMNTAVIVIAAAIAISWAWASVQVVQKNYALQRTVDDKQRQKQLIDLETQNLAYQKAYYQSSEYLDLQVRKLLGLANPGERVLILPPNSEEIKQLDKEMSSTKTVTPQQVETPSNTQQWADFLFGGAHRAAENS